VLPIHVEVWLAAATLHERGLSQFSKREIVKTVRELFGDSRQRGSTHVTAHCCATAPANVATPRNYLTRVGRSGYQLWRVGDSIHESRRCSPVAPEMDQVAKDYRAAQSSSEAPAIKRARRLIAWPGTDGVDQRSSVIFACSFAPAIGIGSTRGEDRASFGDRD
jgi:hypothetical protein